MAPWRYFLLIVSTVGFVLGGYMLGRADHITPETGGNVGAPYCKQLGGAPA